MPSQIYLISPADCSGRRARQLLNESAVTPLASRLRAAPGAQIGDVFAFISSLYFRAKLAYATAFAGPPQRCPVVLVIAPGRGLVPPDTPVTAHDLTAMAETSVDPDNPEYSTPLIRDATRMLESMSPDERAVLLGSVATDKYVGPLSKVLGGRLYLPSAFVGRGAMSRGGLLLRAIEARLELEYVCAAAAVRRGPRPPRLEARE